MAKEWVLNIALNRWQFNRPKYVGKVSEEIRKCQPKSLEDWKEYYYKNVRPVKYIGGCSKNPHWSVIINIRGE